MHTEFTTFPIEKIIDGKCGCGRTCTRPGKHPAVQYGKIKKGESIQHEEGQGYGVLTGERSGIFVVDIDVKEDKNGFEDFLALGECPTTYTVTTPSGGAHIYFRLPNFVVHNSVSRLAPLVDIRGDGGYVLGVGSPHKLGGVYGLGVDAEIADPPGWLLDALHALEGERQIAPTQTSAVPLSGEALAINIVKAKHWLKEKAPLSESGKGGHQKAFVVAQNLIRTLQIPVEGAKDLWLEHYNPRLKEAWSDYDVLHKLIDARDVGSFDVGEPRDLFAGLKKRTIDTMSTNGDDFSRRNKKTDEAHEAFDYTFVVGMGEPTEDAKRADISKIINGLTLYKDWDGVFQHDALADRILAVRPPMRLECEQDGCGLTQADVTSVMAWFAVKRNWLARREDMWGAIECVAKMRSYHPIREYLKEVGQGPTDILSDIATRYFAAQGEMSNLLITKFLVGAYRRVVYRSPVHSMLVLEGKEGIGKSRSLRALFGEYTKEGLTTIEGKDAQIEIQGKWCVELAECEQYTSKASRLKDFLTREYDDYRGVHERTSKSRPRLCVFAGTTNESLYLPGDGTNRRTWPVYIDGRIDVDGLSAHRDEIWAAVATLADEEGYKHYLSDEEEAQCFAIRADRMEYDDWTDRVMSATRDEDQVRTNEILEKIFEGSTTPADKMTTPNRKRVAAILTRHGWRMKQLPKDERGIRRAVYIRVTQ